MSIRFALEVKKALSGSGLQVTIRGNGEKAWLNVTDGRDKVGAPHGRPAEHARDLSLTAREIKQLFEFMP